MSCEDIERQLACVPLALAQEAAHAVHRHSAESQFTCTNPSPAAPQRPRRFHSTATSLLRPPPLRRAAQRSPSH